MEASASTHDAPGVAPAFVQTAESRKDERLVPMLFLGVIPRDRVRDVRTDRRSRMAAARHPPHLTGFRVKMLSYIGAAVALWIALDILFLLVRGTADE